MTIHYNIRLLADDAPHVSLVTRVEAEGSVLDFFRTRPINDTLARHGALLFRGFEINDDHEFSRWSRHWLRRSSTTGNDRLKGKRQRTTSTPALSTLRKKPSPITARTHSRTSYPERSYSTLAGSLVAAVNAIRRQPTNSRSTGRRCRGVVPPARHPLFAQFRRRLRSVVAGSLPDRRSGRR